MSADDKLEYSATGPFYRMVVAYKTAIAGLVIFRPELREIRHQLPPVGLGSRVYESLAFPYSEMDELYRSKEFTEGVITDSLAFMLINTAFEAVKQLLSRSNPTHEFFRHLRNAASHGGKWNFRGKEPKFPAKWRDREVTADLQGQSIWKVRIGPGDILVLLWDIERGLKS